MNRPHVHDESCPGACSRESEIDARSVTGLHRLVKVVKEAKAQGRPPRRNDRSLAWWFGYHAVKALTQIAGLVGLAWIAKKLGLHISGGLP